MTYDLLKTGSHNNNHFIKFHLIIISLTWIFFLFVPLQNDAFLAPVDVSRVEDYMKFVVYPMDLSLMERVRFILN